MNTVLFSTGVAAAAFQHNQYIQYELWVALCFVKTGHEHTSKVFEPASNEAEWALYSTSFLFENISVVKCTAAYADWNRRLTPFIPVNLLLLTYIRVFFRNYCNVPHLQHWVWRCHFGMAKCQHRKVLISFYNDAHMFSIFFFIRIIFGCLTGA